MYILSEKKNAYVHVNPAIEAIATLPKGKAEGIHYENGPC